MQRTTRANLQWRVWIAIYALLIQALLPSFVHAAAPQGSHFAEVCTAFGIKKLNTLDSGSSGSVSPIKQCPLCQLADALALPTSLLVVCEHLRVTFEHPLPCGHAYTPETRLAVYLRGPPIPA